MSTVIEESSKQSLSNTRYVPTTEKKNLLHADRNNQCLQDKKTPVLGALTLLSTVERSTRCDMLRPFSFFQSNSCLPIFVPLCLSVCLSAHVNHALENRTYGTVSQPGSGIVIGSPSSGTEASQSDAASTLEEGGSLASAQDNQPLSHREIAELSFTFCILWFAANWATNASLAYTTVASSTILASMSGFFTLAIGAILKTESFSTLKLIAVCASVAGVALVSESDRSETNDLLLDPKAPIAPLFGDFLALMSAMFYGCYTVLLKVKIQNESRVNMSLFFGFVGLFNIVLLWPMFGVLHWTGVEPFELPADTKVVWMIGINAIVGTFV